MKRWWILIIPAVLAALAAAFLLLSFHALSSRTAANTRVVSSRSSDQAGKNVPYSSIAFSVSADDSLARALERAFIRQAGMQRQPVQSDQADGPLLLVEVKEQKVFWTPFYATAILGVKASYASNGDISFHQTDPVHFDLANGEDVLLIDGRYDLTDASWGVASLPGYQGFLAEQIAAHVLKSLQEEANR